MQPCHQAPYWASFAFALHYIGRARFLVLVDHISLIVGSQNRDRDLDLINCAAQEHAHMLGVNPLHGYRLCPHRVCSRASNPADSN